MPSRYLAGAIVILLVFTPALHAEPNRFFVAGVNYPWIAYGHDFGKNAWGHDGIITGGWSYQTYFNSQGFVDSRFSEATARSGMKSLRLVADLVGKHPNKSKGEIYVDLRSHTPPGVAVPIDLTNATVSCWLFLPRGSAGSHDAPNGVQFFFKSEGFKSLYTAYQNIEPEQEERWVRFTADASAAAHIDDGYDPKNVFIVGIKIGINDQSDATLAAPIFLDDYAISTTPAIAFDFEKLEIEYDFAALQEALGDCSVPTVRVFVFADGRASPEFALDDQVTGFDEYFFDDFDALLAAAARYDLKVIPVLLDFSWFDVPKEDDPNDGVQLGKRSGVLRNTKRREAFLENALRPLVQQYCGHPQILAWDVINEPEWATRELPTDFQTRELPTDFQTSDPVALAEMQEFVRLSAEVIHSCTGQTVTVGSARRMWLHHWSGLGIDLYQFPLLSKIGRNR